MKLHRALAVLVLLLAPMAFAQIAANLRGRVLDPSGAAIANARVQLTETSTSITQATITSSTGDYIFTQLNPGTYSIDVTATGFQQLNRTGITLSVGQTVGVDLTLAIGSQQAVTVNADAPILQSQTSDIQTTIPGHIIVAMPLNTRNFIQLTTLAPEIGRAHV